MASAIHSAPAIIAGSPQVTHVNLTWPTLAEVPFTRLAEGPPVIVQSFPTASPICCLPQQIIKTQAFDTRDRAVLRACPHFETTKACFLGVSCPYVHVCTLAPGPQSMMQLAAILALQQQQQQQQQEQQRLMQNQIAALAAAFSAIPGRSTTAPTAANQFAPPQASLPYSVSGLPSLLHPFTGFTADAMSYHPTATHHHFQTVPRTSAPMPAYPPEPPPQGISTAPTLEMPRAVPARTEAPRSRSKGLLKFSSSRQRKGNKVVDIPAAAEGDSEAGPRQLIIHYLAPRIEIAALRTLFEQYGAIEDAHIVSDTRTGVSRGIALLTYCRCVDAESAVEGANGKVLLGKRIRVSYLNPQRPVNDHRSLSEVAIQLDDLLQPDDAGTAGLRDDVSSSGRDE